jgi:hypothetical protein
MSDKPIRELMANRCSNCAYYERKHSEQADCSNCAYYERKHSEQAERINRLKEDLEVCACVITLMDSNPKEKWTDDMKRHIRSSVEVSCKVAERKIKEKDNG